MLETINQSDIYKVPQDLINQLINLYHQGNYEQALKQGTKLLQQYPQAPAIHNIIGRRTLHPRPTRSVRTPFTSSLKTTTPKPLFQP